MSMAEESYVMLTLFIPKEDYTAIDHVLKYNIQNDPHLNTILGNVTVGNVSVTYKLNSDYTIGILISCKGVYKKPYHLIVKRLSDINDVINIDKKKHQLQICCM